ncbi:MAG: hypothetical protein COA45_11315 [Zetaproteobacteria bacterium]|nr:MAG: hypothetical protein COA45_11315 [Zetaproteobacteria bacterium]
MFKKLNFSPAPKSLKWTIITAFMCSGCSNFYWPQHGHSGMAEEHPHMVHWHYKRQQLDLIEMQITDARQDIHILKHNDAVKYHPALMHNIDMQFVLIEREFEGHFYKETENYLVKLKDLIKQAQDKMEKRQT